MSYEGGERRRGRGMSGSGSDGSASENSFDLAAAEAEVGEVVAPVTHEPPAEDDGDGARTHEVEPEGEGPQGGAEAEGRRGRRSRDAEEGAAVADHGQQEEDGDEEREGGSGRRAGAAPAEGGRKRSTHHTSYPPPPVPPVATDAAASAAAGDAAGDEGVDLLPTARPRLEGRDDLESGSGTGCYCGIAVAGQDLTRMNCYAGLESLDRVQLLLGFLLCCLGIGFGATEHARQCTPGLRSLMLGIGVMFLLYMLSLMIGACVLHRRIQSTVSVAQEEHETARFSRLAIVLRGAAWLIVFIILCVATTRSWSRRMYAECPDEWEHYRLFRSFASFWLLLAALRGLWFAGLQLCPARIPATRSKKPIGQLRLTHLRQTFQTYDRDSSGFLDDNELYEALVAGGVRLEADSEAAHSRRVQQKMRRAVQQVRQRIDTDRDGVVSFDEFCVAYGELQQFADEHSSREVVHKQFGEGGVVLGAADSFQAVRRPAYMAHLGMFHDMTDEQLRVLRMIFDHFDEDSSGSLDINELVNVASFLSSFSQEEEEGHTVEMPLGESRDSMLYARARQLKQVADVDKNGKISFEEFVQCIGHLEHADRDAEPRVRRITGPLFPAVFQLVTNRVLSMPTTGLQTFEKVAERLDADRPAFQQDLQKFSETRSREPIDPAAEVTMRAQRGRTGGGAAQPAAAEDATPDEAGSGSLDRKGEEEGGAGDAAEGEEIDAGAT